jgi:hypothetical protein
MRIHFTQTGGFAGLTKTFKTEVGSLPSEDASALTSLIEDSRWHDVSVVAAPSFPDAFEYELEMTDAKEVRHFFFHDGNVPESLQALVTWLSERADYAKNHG